MTDRILHKYTSRAIGENGSTGGLEVTDGTEVEDLGCFGWLRGVRDRAIMLELRKRNGNIIAIGYSWLERAEFDPSEGITLHVLGQKIRIKGRSLNAEARPMVRLFEGITRHRVTWVREATQRDGMNATAADTVIDAIECE